MSGFPYNVLDEMSKAMKDRLEGVEAESFVNRPLRMTDPSMAVGLFPLNWQPVIESAQIGQVEPALNRYEIRVQTLVKHSNELEGRALATFLGKSVRVILYRDPQLKVGLLALSEELLSSKETFKRFGIRRQNLQNADVRGIWNYLTTTEIWFESEVVQLG